MWSSWKNTAGIWNGSKSYGKSYSIFLQWNIITVALAVRTCIFLIRIEVSIISTFIPIIDDANDAKATEFRYYIQSDGCMASVVFSRRSHGKGSHCDNLIFSVADIYFTFVVLESFPSTSAEFRMLPREVDISKWKRGIYRLEKEPKGLSVQLLQYLRVLGIDPGN